MSNPSSSESSHSTAPLHEPGWERKTLETLALSTINEQRSSRRWKIFFRLVWLSLIVGFVSWSIWGASFNQKPAALHTALIEIRGPILSQSASGTLPLLNALRNAFEDPAAQAVVLLINSPGGSPVQAGIITDEIHRLKAKYGKPIHAVVEETCASAAYYIASAADNIYVDKASLVGSIGVLMNGFGFTDLMDKLGIERRLLIAGDNKGFMDPFSPNTPEQQAHAQTMIDEIHQQFIDVVRHGRGDRLQVTPDLFSGLVWTGERAVALGLADALGSLDSVARDVIGQERIIDYTQRDNLAERLARRLGAGAGDAAVRSLQSSGWQLQ